MDTKEVFSRIMNHELLTREETILYEIPTPHSCIVSIFK